MEFTFICPLNNKAYKTEAFRIVSNRGIQEDAAGQKYLAAMLHVDRPCPYCGANHMYPAKEVACPFNGE
jgi:hypothetical protein